MKKTTILEILKYSILFIAASAIILTEKFINNDFDFLITLLVLVIAIALEFVIESKLKTIKKEEERIKIEENKKLIIAKLEELKNLNDCYYLMYMLITNQCIELNTLINKANLKISYDYVKEDNIIEIDINSTSLRTKLFYSTGLYNDDNNMYLMLSEEDKEIKLTNESYNDIVGLIANDINTYYKTLTTDKFLDKLEEKAKQNNK